MVQLGPFQTLHSTVQLNQNTHFNTIFESTWHHNWHLSSLAKMVDINWGAIIWQPPLLTSGQIELSTWNSIQKNMITLLIHILQLSASYQTTVLGNCILGMGNLSIHVPVTYESFWKRISHKNTIQLFCLLILFASW